MIPSRIEYHVPKIIASTYEISVWEKRAAEQNLYFSYWIIEYYGQKKRVSENTITYNKS